LALCCERRRPGGDILIALLALAGRVLNDSSYDINPVVARARLSPEVIPESDRAYQVRLTRGSSGKRGGKADSC